MSMPRRQRWFMIAAGVAVGLLILDRLVLTPLADHWKKRSAEIANLQRSIAAGRGVLERKDRTESLWKAIQSGSLPADAATAEQTVLSAFDQWGRSSRIEIASIKPQWKRGANAKYSLLECRVDASGPLSNLTRLLHEVERSPLALRVDSIELSSRDERGQTLSLGLVVTGLRLIPLEARP
jgi:hypothetical protein